MGEFLIRSTAILAVAGYAGRLLVDMTRPCDDCRQRIARAIWTLGCAALLVHVTCAFAFQHGWSHARAWEHTRERTFALTGWNSGFGLWVNYGMTAMWLVDVIGWWRTLDWPQQRVWYWTVQAVFAFLMFNATVVFGPWYWRPIAGVFVAAAIGMLVVRSTSAATRRQ